MISSDIDEKCHARCLDLNLLLPQRICVQTVGNDWLDVPSQALHAKQQDDFSMERTTRWNTTALVAYLRNMANAASTKAAIARSTLKAFYRECHGSLPDFLSRQGNDRAR
jgi:hypothetical protein